MEVTNYLLTGMTLQVTLWKHQTFEAALKTGGNLTLHDIPTIQCVCVCN